MIYSQTDGDLVLDDAEKQYVLKMKDLPRKKNRARNL